MKKFFYLKLIMVVIFGSMNYYGFPQDRYGGATLYTVRNEMRDNPQETLKKVAEVGYKYIEATDYKDGKFYGMSPDEFKNQLGDLGLIPLSIHMGMATPENADQLIADVKAAGFKYFVAPVPPRDFFEFDRNTRSLKMTGDLDSMISVLNTLGEKCKTAGLEFLYHNHNFEFEKNKDGIVPIEYMLENLDPEIVNFQMDIYWVKKGGGDPLKTLKKYKGRIPILHVKDMAPGEKQDFICPGSGIIDFAPIFKEAQKQGIKHYIVERDNEPDGIGCLKSSGEFLRNIRF